jgi:hypothetical protein
MLRRLEAVLDAPHCNSPPPSSILRLYRVCSRQFLFCSQFLCPLYITIHLDLPGKTDAFCCLLFFPALLRNVVQLFSHHLQCSECTSPPIVEISAGGLSCENTQFSILAICAFFHVYRWLVLLPNCLCAGNSIMCYQCVVLQHRLPPGCPGARTNHSQAVTFMSVVCPFHRLLPGLSVPLASS